MDIDEAEMKYEIKRRRVRTFCMANFLFEFDSQHDLRIIMFMPVICY